MYAQLLLVTVAGLPLLLAAAGCASNQASIPLGEWSGSGTCVRYGLKEHEESIIASERYEARAWIHEQTMRDKKVVVIRILSMHSDPSWGSINITLVLTKQKSIDTGIVFYGVGSELHATTQASQGSDPMKPTEEMVAQALKDTNRPRCRRFRTGSAVVLHIHYDWPTDGGAFADTLVFDGNRLIKTGHYIASRSEEVSWAEELHRVK